MELLRDLVALFFFSLGLIFAVAGVVGIFRFPDPYARLQSGSLAGTTATISIFLGALVLAPSLAMAGRIIVIVIFFLLSSPTGSHLIARFTWNSGVTDWKPKGSSRSGQETTPPSGDTP